MKSSFLRWVLPGVAAFVLVLLVRMPAAWLLPLLSSTLSCAAPQGTVWNGGCAGARIGIGPGQSVALDQVSWSLRPAALLRGRLSAQLRIQQAGGEVGALVSRGGRHLSVQSMAGQLQVDRNLVPMLPAGWHGALVADDLAFALDGNRITALRGAAGVQQLRDGQGNAFGSYLLTFDQDASGPPFAGQLRDTAGPLSVRATVRIEPQGAWQVDGRVAPRADASPALVQQLRLLGLPAADGSYPFSLAGE